MQLHCGAVDELYAGWRLAVRRLAVRWRLMVVAGVGILLAASLLAAGPLYTDAMSDLGLRFRLDRGLDLPREQTVSATIEGLLAGDPTDRARAEALDAVTQARIGWLSEELLTADRTNAVGLRFLDPDGALEEGRTAWTGPVVALSGYEGHVSVTQGRLPGASADGLEVVLPDGFQSHAGLGDRLRLQPSAVNDCPPIPPSEDPDVAADEVPCRPTTFASFTTTATVVGFVAPNDVDDLRWQLFRDGWDVPDGPITRRGILVRGEGVMPLLTSGEQFRESVTRQLPLLNASHRVAVNPDLDRIAVGEVGRAIDDLAAWRVDLNDGLGLAVIFQTDFADELEGFRTADTFSQVPLLVILLQVAGVVLFFVVLVMLLLLDAESNETGVLRSRGASIGQLVGLTLLEGLALAVPAAIVAPWLAARVVSVLGRTPIFEGVTGGDALPVSVTADASLLAALGAGAALLAALLPATLRAGQSIVATKRGQSRPPGRSLVQRYYLDLAVVALAVALVWQLDRRETAFDAESVGGWSADPLLLSAPLVLTLAAAGLVLRVYPPLLRLAVRLLLQLRGTAVAIGLRAAGRAPGPQARLMLLLVMAVSVGTFAASYAPTVGTSYEERVRYEHGVDLRGTLRIPAGPEADTSLAAQLEAVRELDGVRDATVVHRGSLGLPRGGSLSLLAIDDPGRAPDMLWFRDDFADETPPQLLRQLQSLAPPGAGIAIPDDAVALELQVLSEIEASFLLNRLAFRLRDGRGVVIDTIVDRPEGEGWLTASAELPPESEAPRPLTLIGMRVAERARFTREAGELFMDDITAVGATGVRTVIEDFEDGFDWTMYSQRASEEVFELSGAQSTSGNSSARWNWITEQIARERVLAIDDPALPLTAIVDERALERLGAVPDHVVTLLLGEDDLGVPVRIRTAVSLFPTLSPENGFAIVSLRQLRSIAGTVGDGEAQLASELWVDFEEELPLASQLALVALLTDEAASPLLVLPEPRHLEAALAEVAANPTLQGAGNGILLVGAGAVLAAALLGLIVALVVSVRGRLLEFAVLRALGASSGQLLRSLLLEWGVVLVVGTMVGVVLGRMIAGTMLSFLELTEEGTRVLPPFVVATDWGALTLALAALAVALLLALWLSWRAVVRDSAARELRLTQ